MQHRPDRQANRIQQRAFVRASPCFSILAARAIGRARASMHFIRMSAALRYLAFTDEICLADQSEVSHSAGPGSYESRPNRRARDRAAQTQHSSQQKGWGLAPTTPLVASTLNQAQPPLFYSSFRIRACAKLTIGPGVAGVKRCALHYHCQSDSRLDGQPGTTFRIRVASSVCT